MDGAKYVCICTDNGPNKTIEESKIKTASVRRITSRLLQNESPLFISTPNFMISMPGHEVPLKTYPKLALDKKPSKYRRPDYYLFQSNKISPETIYLYLNIKHNSKHQIPKIIIEFKVTELSSLTIQTFIERIDEQLNGSGNVKQVFIKNKVQKKEEHLKLDFNEYPEIFLEVEFNENGLNKIQHRSNLIHEILETEKQYLYDLTQINDFWSKQMKNKNLLTESEHNNIFKDIPQILDNQNKFYDRYTIIEKEEYSGLTSVFFLENYSLIEKSVHYISMYPLINEMLENKKQNRTFASTLFELQQMTDGRDILSFLITPIQRLPRYLLFIKELIKITPQTHPDSILLPIAEEIFTKINKEADIATNNVRQQSVLKKIQDKLKKYRLRLAEPNRQIIMHVEISLYDNKKTVTSYLCLCNDIIFVYVDRVKHAKLILLSDISIFHYLPIVGDFHSLIVPTIIREKDRFERIEYRINFNKFEEKSQFTDHITNLLEEYSNKNEKNKYIIWTLNSITDSIPSICQHASVSNGESIIFNGGISTSQRLVFSDFATYHQTLLRDYPLSEMTTMESGIMGRRRHTFSYLNGSFYLIGGLIGNKESPEIMQYNIQTQKWHQFSIRTQFYRYGHSCVNYKDKLYIFGGKSKQNGISSELIVLDPNNKSFEVIPNNSNVKPESRFDHSAVVYNHKMYIFGGKGAKGYILDIWSYDFESNTWKKEMLNEPKNSEREKLVGRKSHLSFLINNAMIIIGGESDIPETPTFIIDLNTFQVHYLDDIGNFPPSIRYASGGILSNQEIIVYGGIEYHSKQPLNTFYTLRLSSNWNEGITINRNNSQDEQMFEQNQWSNVLNQNCCHTTISHKATYVPLKSKTPVAPLSIGSRQPLSTDGSRTRSNSEDLTPTARPRRQSSTAAHDRKTRKKRSQSVSIKNVSSTTISIEKLSPNRMAAINYIGEDGVKTISDYSGKAPPPLDIDMNEEPSNKETEQPTNGARPRLSFESGSRKMSFPRFKSNFVEESSNNNNNSESPLNTNSEVNMQNGDDPNLESFPAFRPVSAQRLSPRGGSFSPRSTLIRRNNVSNDNDNAPEEFPNIGNRQTPLRTVHREISDNTTNANANVNVNSNVNAVARQLPKSSAPRMRRMSVQINRRYNPLQESLSSPQTSSQSPQQQTANATPQQQQIQQQQQQISSAFIRPQRSSVSVSGRRMSVQVGRRYGPGAGLLGNDSGNYGTTPRGMRPNAQQTDFRPPSRSNVQLRPSSRQTQRDRPTSRFSQKGN